MIASVSLPAHATTTSTGATATATTTTTAPVLTSDALVNFPAGGAVFFNTANAGNGETSLAAAAAGNMGYSLTQFQSGSYMRPNRCAQSDCHKSKYANK
ncbi:MAG: hypothetical protein ACI9J2_002170 [Saprospiraceae bacterium]|jgi:hypothetical protein